MADIAVPAPFEHIAEADQVALYISVWIGERIANAGLSGQVSDAFELVFREQLLHSKAVCQIRFDELKTVQRQKLLQSVAFQLNTIVVVYIIESNDLLATLQKGSGQMKSDKSCRTRDQNLTH